jgi:hypothetical protein
MGFPYTENLSDLALEVAKSLYSELGQSKNWGFHDIFEAAKKATIDADFYKCPSVSLECLQSSKCPNALWDYEIGLEPFQSGFDDAIVTIAYWAIVADIVGITLTIVNSEGV